jgi:hypothetical protein
MKTGILPLQSNLVPLSLLLSVRDLQGFLVARNQTLVAWLVVWLLPGLSLTETFGTELSLLAIELRLALVLTIQHSPVHQLLEICSEGEEHGNILF